MNASKPTLFFVHGAWHQSAHFQPIIEKLVADGFPAVCPTQPTFDRSGEDLQKLNMYDDAAFIRKELEQLIEGQRREVVVVLHSYGGLVGTQAVDASLGWRSRNVAGKKGGVLRIVYMCAFMLPLNACPGDDFGGGFPPFIKTEPDGSCILLDPRTRFYGGLDDATAQRWLSLTRPHVARTQLTPLTYTAYLHHPLTYILGTDDQAIPADVQRGMCAGVKAHGLDFDVLEIATDHSPYLSKEADIVAILESLASRDSAAVAA